MATLVEGAIVNLLPISPVLTVLGFYIMILGGIILMATFGLFTGTPYRSRILNLADQRLKERERRRYAD
jgi:hypothetical protein